MSENQARTVSVFDRAFLTGVDDVTELVMVRHGEQEVGDWATSSVGTFDDPPLSDRGRTQARLVGERLSTDKIDAVYASPLVRAYETGREIARHHRLEPIVNDDIRVPESSFRIRWNRIPDGEKVDLTHYQLDCVPNVVCSVTDTVRNRSLILQL